MRASNPWRVIADYRGKLAGKPSETIHICATYEEAIRSRNHHGFYMRDYAQCRVERGTNLDHVTQTNGEHHESF